MLCKEQKNTARDEAECCDILFSHKDVFCDLLQYRAQKMKAFCFIQEKSFNERGENPRKHFAQVHHAIG